MVFFAVYFFLTNAPKAGGFLHAVGADHTARNLLAGIARRLGGKIIGTGMDNHGFADDLGHAEATGQHHAERISAGFKQRRQIARVLRMLAAAGIVVRHRAGEGVRHITRADAAFVDMEAEHTPGTRAVFMRKPTNFRAHQHAARRLEKLHGAADIGIRVASAHVSHGLRPAGAEGEFPHKITSHGMVCRVR